MLFTVADAVGGDLTSIVDIGRKFRILSGADNFATGLSGHQLIEIMEHARFIEKSVLGSVSLERGPPSHLAIIVD